MSDNTSAAARLRELDNLILHGNPREAMAAQDTYLDAADVIAAVIEDAEDREQGEHIGECRCSRRRALAALSARLNGGE